MFLKINILLLKVINLNFSKFIELKYLDLLRYFKLYIYFFILTFLIK